MQVILSLATINMKMTAEEALTAATLNGARAIGRSREMGSLEVNKLANFLVFDAESYEEIFYHFGSNSLKEVWVKGRRLV